MNKLGFYIENTTVQFLRDALRQVKPRTILIHAGDRGLLREIRQDLSPDSFVVGRLFVPLQTQVAWLDDPNPAARGRDFANQILNYDFGLATERGANGRLLIDAWMSLNEVLPGPASAPNHDQNPEFQRRAAALDSFQVAFRQQLQTAGLEAVAFNFGAGNYIQAEHYTRWFPNTLQSYIYLGFHEYGWPTMEPNPALGTATACLLYRACMPGIRTQYGNRHKAIITEAGLARMYKYPSDGAGDVGWLYPGETITEAQYWQSLQWYNARMVEDDYVLGCCLFQVGHSGRWASFRHLGQNNQQEPILLIPKIATLNADGGGTTPPDPTDLQGRITALLIELNAAVRLTADYVDQVNGLNAALTGLAPVAIQAAALPADLNRLLSRVRQLEAEVQRLMALPGANTADLQALLQQIQAVEAQIVALQPAADQAAQLAGDTEQARQALAPLQAEVGQAQQLNQEATTMLAEAQRLADQAGVGRSVVAQPAMNDVRTEAEAPARAVGDQPAFVDQFPRRALAAIRRIVVHHTVTREDITPERLTAIHVAQGLPGPRYHFLVNGDGTIHWLQPLEAVLPQTRVEEVNADGVAVALAGTFSQKSPSDEQIAGAAEVIAWLLSRLQLDGSAVYGRSELDHRVVSPGAQWMQGCCFKENLLDAVDLIMAASTA